MPEDLVFQNPVFRPEMNGQKVPHDIYVHIAGIDIVRVDADTFYVLEDNARTPSGVSYMLENREIMMRLFPELFSRHRVAPVENYPDELLATLKSVAPDVASGDPTVVLLTPGVYNSAYYEHSFLADKLGIELVEGRDLFVKGGIVYMRTTQGPKRVDVIYRRIDDDFLDPLAFRPDSALGVAGLMSAYQAGNVTLANAVGTGIADDKAIYSYMPEIVKFYLGEEPILKNVPTWRCREPEQLAYVLDHLEELVVKEVHGSGGYGMLIGPTADKAQIAAFRTKLKLDPKELHRAADARALDLSDLRRVRRRAAACRSAPLRAHRPRQDPHRAGRADARRAEGRLAGREFQPGRRHQRHLGAGHGSPCSPAPPTTSTGSPATSNARNISRAFSRRRSALTRCRSLTSARPTNGNPRSRPPAVRRPSSPSTTRPTKRPSPISWHSPTDNPSSIRNCFEVARAQRARGAHRADHGDVGGDQRAPGSS